MGFIISLIITTITPNVYSMNHQIEINTIETTKLDSFDPYLEGWNYRKTITINNNQVIGEHSNFPILLNIIDGDLIYNTEPDGEDIIFMNDKGTAEKLFHEIEFFQRSSGKLVAWINIPILSENTQTIIYMYYGNQNFENQDDTSMVWDTDYIAVFHMTDLIDSTGKYNLTSIGATSDSYGKIGGCYDLESSEEDYIARGGLLDSFPDNITIEVWFSIESSKEQSILSKINSEIDYFSFDVLKNNDLRFSGKGKDNFWIHHFGNIEYLNIFYYSAIICEKNQQTTIFLNDNYEKAGGIFIPLDSGSIRYFYIGKYFSLTGDEKYFDGKIDEIRISKSARSYDWIKTSYNTMNYPNNFLNVGPQETQQPPQNPTILGPTTGNIGQVYNYSFSSTDPENQYLFYWIDWGDGNEEEWIGPYFSGEVITRDHTWDSSRIYSIKCKVKDVLGEESDWSKLEVKISKSKYINKNQFLIDFWEFINLFFPGLKLITNNFIKNC
jgi:hypothetical protein